VPIEIRPATVADLPALERRCWRGGEAEMRQRLRDQGTCSIIALDAGRPIAQLYLRGYRRGFRSPRGLHDGSWWADLKGVEDQVALPPRTAMLGCWHVGRVRDADGTEREAEEYRGRGLGVGLLRAAIDWLRAPGSRYDALAAKGTDSEDRSYIGWVGGLPASAFASLGFERLATFEDPYFVAEPEAVPATAVAVHPARFHLMLLRREEPQSGAA
jgi:GNAT superfamily N-acetyltransferase